MPSPKLHLWVLISEIVTKFLANSDICEHDKFFKTVKKLLSLPFQHSTDNHAQVYINFKKLLSQYVLIATYCIFLILIIY